MTGATRTGRWAERARSEHGAGGVLHLLGRVGHKLGSPVLAWGRLSFFERDLSGELPERPSRGEVELRQALPAEVDRLIFGERPFTAAHFAERFRLGHQCFVAVDGEGPFAHARWVTTDRAYIPELDSDVVLRPGEAYMYDGYTRPDARGAGLDGAMRCFIFRSMREAGRHRVYSYVRGDNPVGLRAARRWQTSAGTVRYASLRGRAPGVRSGRGRLPQLVKRARETPERTQRAQALRSWFQGWTVLPLENRSTGYTAPPEAYFASTARYVVDALALDARDDVLDVGCDSAMVSRLVAPHCRRFVGVDFIPELLAEIGRAGLMLPGAASAAFVAADGRQLPFSSATFTKVYCTGVIHALPSRQDGLAMLKELVRVCAPGGRVLVAAIPDDRKRWRRRHDLWKQGGLKLRLQIILSLVTPVFAKRMIRRLAGSTWPSGPSFLDYDMGELARSVEGDGIRVQVSSFPNDYWSEDFRRTRSNLLVMKVPLRR